MAENQLDYQKILANVAGELGISQLPEEQQTELMANVAEALMKRIYFETLDKLSDADVDEYEQLIETNAAPREMADFLESRIKNYSEFVLTVVEVFKKEMLAVLGGKPVTQNA